MPASTGAHEQKPARRLVWPAEQQIAIVFLIEIRVVHLMSDGKALAPEPSQRASDFARRLIPSPLREKAAVAAGVADLRQRVEVMEGKQNASDDRDPARVQEI
jgi:hypothetical protein